MTILEFVQTEYAAARIDCGKEALYQLECAARVLARQIGKMPNISELDEPMILRHLRWLRTEGRSPSTIQRRRGHLLGIWKLAVKKRKNKHKFHEADVPTITPNKTIPRAWSIEDLDRMLKACDTVTNKDFTGKNWRALIMLIYFTGLRISTILRLRKRDFRNLTLRVPAGIQKDKEEMEFRLPRELANALHSQSRPHEVIRGRLLSEMLIPWPWCEDSVQRRFGHQVLEPAGLPSDDPKLKFHAIRRTVATMIDAHHGIQAACQVLGHSDVSVTRRYIADHSTVDPTLQQRLSPVDVMPRLFAG